MGHGGNTPQMKNFAWYCPFCPSKAVAQAGFAAWTSPPVTCLARRRRSATQIVAAKYERFVSGILEVCFESWRVLSSMRIELYSTLITTSKAKSHNGRI